MLEKKMVIDHRSLFTFFLDELVGQAAMSGMPVGTPSVDGDAIAILI